MIKQAHTSTPNQRLFLENLALFLKGEILAFQSQLQISQ